MSDRTGTHVPSAAGARLADALARARQGAAERDAALDRVGQLEQEIVHAAAVRDAEVRRVDALASHVWHLQRQVGDLLGSRRWAIGRRTGDLMDRLLRRHRAVAEDERIRALMDEGRRLLGALGEGRASQAAARARAQAGADGHPDFVRYLCRALVDPLLDAPLDQAGQHALDCMAAYRDHLVERSAGRSGGPLVSVIMPTFDRAHLLPRAIGSVLDQSYEHWELIVVDDGSSDGTDALLRDYEIRTGGRLRAITLEGNRGVSHARNQGLGRARGDVIAYLDSDNYWDERYLSLMTGALEDRPGRESAYCAQEIYEVVPGPTGEPVRRLDGVRFAPFNRSLLENRNSVDLNAFVHTRAALERTGGFDESLPRLVDWELFLRMTAEARPVALPCLLSQYEFGTAKNQLTRTLPVRPATSAIDASTLHRDVLDVELPAAVAARYRNPTLFAPLGSVRPGRPRAVAVVVAPTGDAARLGACLAAVRASAPGGVRFVLLAGEDTASRTAAAQARAAGDVDVVEARGAGGRRAAIERAGERDAVLLDAATIVVPGWLEALWEVLDVCPDAALVVPRVTLPPGAPHVSEHVPYAKTYREADVTLSLADGNVADPWLDDERGFVGLAWARFTCAYLPRRTLAEAGPPPDLDDDVRAARIYGDLLRTRTGHRVVYTPHAKVYHLP